MPEMLCFVSLSACFVDQTFVARECSARVLCNFWLDVTSRKSPPTALGMHILYIKVFWIDFSNFVRRNIFREFILTLKYVYFGFPKDNDVTKKDFIISLTQATSFHCEILHSLCKFLERKPLFLSFIVELNTYMRSQMSFLLIFWPLTPVCIVLSRLQTFIK